MINVICLEKFQKAHRSRCCKLESSNEVFNEVIRHLLLKKSNEKILPSFLEKDVTEFSKHHCLLFPNKYYRIYEGANTLRNLFQLSFLYLTAKSFTSINKLLSTILLTTATTTSTYVKEKLKEIDTHLLFTQKYLQIFGRARQQTHKALKKENKKKNRKHFFISTI